MEGQDTRGAAVLRRAAVVAFLLIGFIGAWAPRASAVTVTLPVDSIVIPMDTTWQDSGMFKAFGLVDALLLADIPVYWVILPGKNRGDLDFTAPSGEDLRTLTPLAGAGYAAGPFAVDGAYYSKALPIVQRWMNDNPALTVHHLTAPVDVPVSATLVAAPSIATLSDLNEGISFNYMNAAGIQQGLSKPAHGGNRVTVSFDATTTSATPAVTLASAGNSVVAGTSIEAPGSKVDVFVGGLFEGQAAVDPAGNWTLGPIAVAPNANVTADVTASGKGTSAQSAAVLSGVLPAGGTTTAPSVTGAIRQGDGTIFGLSAEVDGTIIQVFRNGVSAGTTTVTGGKWKFLPPAVAVGGDIWNATATAPAGTTSALSNFITTVPVPATVTGPLTTASISITGGYQMANGSPVNVWDASSAGDTELGTVNVANSAWTFGVAPGAIAAGDVIRADVDLFPWPAGADITGAYACPGTFCSPDSLTLNSVKGPTTTSHTDGSLFDGAGIPQFCQIMSMHYATPGDPEVVAEVRSFLQFPTHAMMECLAISAYENDAVSGHFLTTNGVVTSRGTVNTFFYSQDSPFAQSSGTYRNVGGAVPFFNLAPGSIYWDPTSVLLSATDVPGTHGTDDIWAAGFVDGDPSKGKVSYLGAHQYTTTLPLSVNSTSVGTRYFLDSLFEAPCASETSPFLALNLFGPQCTDGSPVLYQIKYGAHGIPNLRNVLIEVPLPPGVVFNSATGNYTFDAGTSLITWNLGNLDDGAIGTETFTVGFAGTSTYRMEAEGFYRAALTPKTATPAPIDITVDASGLPPTMSCLPQVDAQANDTGKASCIVVANASAICNPVTVTNDRTPNGADASDTYPCGSTRVTFTAVDGLGRVGTCSTLVVVHDLTPPALTCPAPVDVNSDPSGSAQVSLLASATDNCGGAAPITNDRTAGGADASGTYPCGRTVVTFTSRDAAGNVSTCQTTVSVHDLVAPTLTCAADMSVQADSPDGAMVGVIATVHDACDPAPVVTNDHTPNGLDATGFYPCGVTPVVFTATDAAGNVSSCTTTITVTSGPLVPVMAALRGTKDQANPHTIVHWQWALAPPRQPWEHYNVYRMDHRGPRALFPAVSTSTSQTGTSWDDTNAAGPLWYYLVYTADCQQNNSRTQEPW